MWLVTTSVRLPEPCAWVTVAGLLQRSVYCVLSACLIRPLGRRTGGSPAPLPRLLSCPICWDGVLSGFECVHECHWRERLRVFSPASVRKGVFVAESSLPDVKVKFPSALQLLWGNATELRRWWTPQSWRNCVVVVDVNSGPPSVASSSGMPNVEKMRLSAFPWLHRLHV